MVLYGLGRFYMPGKGSHGFAWVYKGFVWEFFPIEQDTQVETCRNGIPV